MNDVDPLRLTVEIVTSYVEKNRVGPQELAALIAEVHRALQPPQAPAAPEPTTPKTTPAQVKRSIRPEGLVSFEDGKVYKTLRRHLASRGLTPEAYRAKWGLPADYPMVAPEYAKLRSDRAKAAGFGRVTRSRKR